MLRSIASSLFGVILGGVLVSMLPLNSKPEAPTIERSADVSVLVEKEVKAQLANRPSPQPSFSEAQVKAAQPASAELDAPSKEAARESDLKALDNLLQAHADAPSGSAWAATAQTTLDADFRAMPSSDAIHVERIDCRSHTCLVSVDWPSSAKIDAERELMHARWNLNCTRTLPIPTFDENTGRHHAQLLFDCDPPQL